MKLMLLVGLLISSMVAIADWQSAEETQEIVVKVDGIEQLVTIDNETAEELAALHSDDD